MRARGILTGSVGMNNYREELIALYNGRDTPKPVFRDQCDDDERCYNCATILYDEEVMA